MFSQKALMCILYTVLAMVIVSLDKTYSITYKLFGNLIGATSMSDYGMGMSFSNKGFLLHILVFAILMAIPMYFSKDSPA